MELKGCITQADSLEELYKNMEEVLNLHLDEPESSTVFFPMPAKNLKGENIIEIPVNPKIGFALAMRMLRRRRGLTQSQIAKLLGMKNLYSYQRLENSRNANPSLTTLARIKRVFPELKIDEILFAGSLEK